MIESSCTKNGKPLRFDVSDTGVKETPIGTCIEMKRGIKAFWERRKIKDLDYSNWEKTKHEEIK